MGVLTTVHTKHRAQAAQQRSTHVQASNSVTKSLAAMDVCQILQLRTLFQLQRHVRTKDGEDLLEALQFGPANLMDVDRADVAWVVEYMDRLELKQDKAAFLELVDRHAMA